MLGARSLSIVATGVFSAALALLQPIQAPAQTISLSLNVFYSSPGNTNSGGTWELVGKSSDFGIVGLDARIANISTAINRAPTASINGGIDTAGFSIFGVTVNPTYRDIALGQAPIDPLTAGKEQSAFYGVGQFANGAPNYPAKPGGSTSEGPAFTSLVSPLEIPWATGDLLGSPTWATAARLASGTFAANVTPSFVAGSSGNVFTSLGTSSAFGSFAAATVSTLVRTNFVSVIGDYNHNGVVDAADYVVWRSTKSQSVTPGSGADGNGNGIIDQADFDVWRAHFGNTSGSGSGGSLSTGTVPEPFSGLLLVMGAMLLWCVERSSQRNRVPALGRLIASPTSFKK